MFPRQIEGDGGTEVRNTISFRPDHYRYVALVSWEVFERLDMYLEATRCAPVPAQEL